MRTGSFSPIKLAQASVWTMTGPATAVAGPVSKGREFCSVRARRSRAGPSELWPIVLSIPIVREAISRGRWYALREGNAILNFVAHSKPAPREFSSDLG